MSVTLVAVAAATREGRVAHVFQLAILPPPQRRFWDEMGATPRDFVLYGGTALALRLGHRHSEDFDFFSNQSFTPADLGARLPYLAGAEITQSQNNTLTAMVDRQGPVKISFLGGLALRRVQDPNVAPENGIAVASLVGLLELALPPGRSGAAAAPPQDSRGGFEPGVRRGTHRASSAMASGRQVKP